MTSTGFEHAVLVIERLVMIFRNKILPDSQIENYGGLGGGGNHFRNNQVTSSLIQMFMTFGK